MTYQDSFEAQEEVPDGWVVVSGDWWQCSYRDVEWIYVRRHHWTDAGVKLTIHPPPSQYHDALYNDKENYGQGGSHVQDLEFSHRSVGVKLAEDALEMYERHVGICDPYQAVPDFTFDAQLLLPGNASEDGLRRHREEWARLVEELLGGILEPSCFDLPIYSPDADVQVWDLGEIDEPYDFDMPDVVDLTLSDISVDSDPLPTTPPGDRKSYAEVLFDDGTTPTHAGTVVSPSPSKPLNASALSFIPSFFLDHHSPSPSSDEPYVSPTYEFHFPSLHSNTAPRSNTRSLPPALQRDEYGFYNEVPPVPTQTQSAMQSRSATPKRPSGVPPSFLGSGPRQGSRTREMVDRLRSSSSGGSRRNKKNKGDGSSLRNPTQASVPQMDKDSEGWIVEVANNHHHKRSKSGKSGDWVEGLFQCRSQGKPEHPQRSHKRSPSSATNTSSTPSTNPAPPTPSSCSSTVSTLPSPTSSTFSDPRTPTNAQFPLPQFYAFQSPYAVYPGTYPIAPQGPPMQVIQATPWPISALVPAHPAFILPPPMYGAGASSPYDTRKAASVGATRLS